MRALLMIALLVVLAGQAQAVEIMQWQRLPLNVPLVVGQERVIFLDRNVRVGMDSSLKNRLRVQSAAGTLYLLPMGEISPSRLQVQDVESGEMILLDIATISGGQALEPIRIVDERTVAGGTDLTGQTTGQAQPSQGIPAPIRLTRYAAQSLFAPLRTVEPVEGLTKVHLRLDDKSLDSLLPTLNVELKALVGYRLENYTVTAVQIRNLSKESVALDPRSLQGHFFAATFQHNWLGESGQPEDTTVIYLITQGGGLEKALFPLPAVAQGPEVKDEK